MNYVTQCTVCNQQHDVKTKSRFAKIKHETYRCKQCILDGKTYSCPQCHGKIVYKAPIFKKIAEETGLICNSCLEPPFTLEQKQILDGLLLGDSSISYASREDSKFPRLTTRRQQQDIEYLDWQLQIFSKYYHQKYPCPISQFDRRTNKTYFAHYIQSKSCETFKTYREKWYPDGTKIVPRDLKLSPLTLLVWFLDDGCVIRKSENNLILKISTDGFTPEDVLFLSQLLSDYLEGQVNMYRNGKGYILKASTKTTKKMIQIIEPIFPKFMDRKRTWANEN